MSKTKLVPFDIEKAKAGAKVVTRIGFSVRIFDYDLKGEYPILATIDCGGSEKPAVYTLKGETSEGVENDDLDLLIEEEVKTRLMTNRELAWWLRDHPEEHREYCFGPAADNKTVFSVYDYSVGDADKEIEDIDILIRKNYGEWMEPLIEE